MTTCEAVWMVGGKAKYVAEAFASARSFRKHHPKWKMRLVTPNTLHRTDTFDDITQVDFDKDRPWYVNLMMWYQLLPNFADHIYLFDSDTRICGPLYGPLRLLQNGYDFLGCHAPGRHTCKSVVEEVGKSEFPEINVGFLAFNGNGNVRRLFRMMLELYLDHMVTYGNNDQGPLRDALWKWDGRFYVLPTEYNFRYCFGGQVRDKVYVLHGRSKTPLEQVERIVNATKDMRAFKGSEF